LRDDFQKDDTSTEFLGNYRGFHVKAEKELSIKLEASKGDMQTCIRPEGKLSLKIRDKDTGCEADLSALPMSPRKESFNEFVTNAFNHQTRQPSNFQSWDDYELSLRVKFSDLDEEEQVRGIRKKMEFNVDDRFFGGAGAISAFDLPLLADDELEAIKWRDHNFVEFLANDYKLPGDCTNYIRVQQDMFAPIACFLRDAPIPNESELEKIVSDNPNAYWHYFAPIDLKP